VNWLRLLLAVALVSGGNICLAQMPGAVTDVPPGPWVMVSAPSFARWNIEYRYSDAAVHGKARAESAQRSKEQTSTDPAYAKMMADSPAMALAMDPPRLQEVAVIKTRNLKQTKMAYEGGLTGERWSDGVVVMARLPGSKNITVDPAAQDPTTQDFQEFSWLSRDTFQTRQKVADREYLIFRENAPALRIIDPKLFYNIQSSNPRSERLKDLVPVTAVVDAATKLPVSLQIGNEFHVYTFLAPDTDMLVLPEEFARAAAQTEGLLRQMHRSHPLP
jgi:hypothetical protein